MIKKGILFILCLLALTNSVTAQQIQSVKGKVKEGYNFLLYTPDGARTDTAGKPVVVFLHGASLCGNNLDRVKRYGTIDAIQKGRRIDAFVIAPQNPGGAWNPRKIMNTVDYVVARHKVDTTRIYVLGMSLGGYGSLDFAATYPDRIAAAIGICGGATVKDLSGLAEMPLWIVHGTGDRDVAVAQSDRVVKAVKAAQTDSIDRLAYDRIPGMNHGRPARLLYHAGIYDWLLSHRLNTPERQATPTFKLSDAVFKNAYQGLRSK